VIKDGCKVAGFVGGVVLTGGTAAIGAGSTLAQATVVISGADLVLEVADDGATIALGNHNKVSALIKSGRTITEPISSILSIVSIPKAAQTGFEKFQTVVTALEQFNGAVQEGKIVGIELPAYSPSTTASPSKVSVLSAQELEPWLKEQGAVTKEASEELAAVLEAIGAISTIPMNDQTIDGSGDEVNTTADTPSVQGVSASDDLKSSTGDTGSVVGVWEGTMTWTPSNDAIEQQDEIRLEFKADGSIRIIKGNWTTKAWKQIESAVRVFGEENSLGYHEFNLVDSRTLRFVKAAGPDSEDPSQWAEVLAGSDFFGGKFLQVTLHRQ
jgi:hypothetical protein